MLAIRHEGLKFASKLGTEMPDRNKNGIVIRDIAQPLILFDPVNQLLLALDLWVAAGFSHVFTLRSFLF